MKYTVTQFFKQFPDDAACLEHLMQIRHGKKLSCPKCSKHGNFTRIRKIPAYQCSCGHQIHPMVGTPFENSKTSLQKWFYAMYLFTTSRHGVSAKELERQLGVTYKTAWRIGHEIRKYLGKVDGNPKLSGHVEVDEGFFGGKTTNAKRYSSKIVVVAMVERGGNIVTKQVTGTTRSSLLPPVFRTVAKGTTLSTDMGRFSRLDGSYMDYKVGAVNHSKGEYVRGIHHTNTIEGFWSLMKRSIAGTHIWVSPKHMPKYLDEFEYRFNMRKQPEQMFSRLLLSF